MSNHLFAKGIKVDSRTILGLLQVSVGHGQLKTQVIHFAAP